MSKLTDLPVLTNPAPDDLAYVVDVSADPDTDNQVTLASLLLAGKTLGIMGDIDTPVAVGTGGVTLTFGTGQQAGLASIDTGSGTFTMPVTGISGGGWYRVSANLVADYTQGDNNSDELLQLSLTGTTIGTFLIDGRLSTGNSAGVSPQFSVVIQLPDSEVISLELSATAAQAVTNLANATFSVERIV